MTPELNADQCRELIAELSVVLEPLLKKPATRPPLASPLEGPPTSRPPGLPVFAGGAIVSLLVTDTGAPPPAFTKDVDVVVEVYSAGDYAYVTHKLLRAGFSQRMSPDLPREAFFWNSRRVDVMPHAVAAGGAHNPWFEHLMRDAKPYAHSRGVAWIASAPCFLATKFAAFHSRGKNDYASSKDIGDIIDVVNGRPELLEELLYADPSVREFLAQESGALLRSDPFRNCLPWLVHDDPLREGIILARLESISALIPQQQAQGVEHDDDGAPFMQDHGDA